MKAAPILILGAGPAAALLSMALKRLGITPMIIGSCRRRTAVEGLSQRVVNALVQFKCGRTLDLLGSRWQRVSRWAGEESSLNGEYVVERRQFDCALMADAIAQGGHLLEGSVRSVRHEGSGYSVRWESPNGGEQVFRTPLLVECRGQAATKIGPDLHAAYSLVAISRTFVNARAHEYTTLTESFEMGWAWGGIDPTGAACIQVVILPDYLRSFGGNIFEAHAACMSRLKLIPRLLGTSGEPVGQASARAIRPALRTAAFTHHYLRVGDACYTNDPLSGHGIFEAASGALASAPAINTLLNYPDDTSIAREFLDFRAKTIYASRMQAARDHYRSEDAFDDRLFWKTMKQFTLPEYHPTLPISAGLRLQQRGVVENGRIISKSVLVSPNYPRGVRFLGAVDLGELVRLTRESPGISCHSISRAMKLPLSDIEQACAFVRSMSRGQSDHNERSDERHDALT